MKLNLPSVNKKAIRKINFWKYGFQALLVIVLGVFSVALYDSVNHQVIKRWDYVSKVVFASDKDYEILKVNIDTAEKIKVASYTSAIEISKKGSSQSQ